MLLPLQSGIIYGPVKSRRLGTSLGINLLSTKRKICTFNCVYCQYGWTQFRERTLEKKKLLPGVREVLEATEKALKEIHPKPAYITFSGNGEPTLHPHFDELADGVVQLRNRFSPKSKTAILTNSTNANQSRVRKALSKLDLCIMKLDCGNEAVFKRYNRPRRRIRLKDIVVSLQLMEATTIQALFSGGSEGNYNPACLDEWIEKILLISPRHVQLYTLDRFYPSKNIRPLSKDELLFIKKRLKAGNIHAEVYL